MIPETGSAAHELAATTRRWLSRDCGNELLRQAVEDPRPDAGWRAPLWQGAVDLGLTGIMTPEELGGAGAGPVELGAAVEELGRALFPGPFLSSVVMVGLAVASCGQGDVARELLRDLVSGTTATLASGPDPASTPLVAEVRDGTWHVSGSAPAVVDAMTAERVIAVARTPSGLGLFAVREVHRSALTALDHTRPLGSLVLVSAPAVLVAEPSSMTEKGLRRAFGLACLVLAAEQLGGSARVLEMAVDHAKTRYQFGRAIGSFQAVKHRCVDMMLQVESARSVVWQGLHTAAAVLDGQADDDALDLAASLARSLASDAYLSVATANIQVHGGIGFTWEHQAHLYLKRARGSQLLLGSPTAHRARLLPLVLADAEASSSDAEVARAEPEVAKFLADTPPATMPDRELRERRFDAGLAMVHFTEGYGGRGWPSSRQSNTEAAFLDAGAEEWTSRNVIGLGMAMATIHAHGTAEQKETYLRPCFIGEHIWCQLFSEPGAGSDLASLSTMAVADGDHFILTGQKVWTSLGHVADYGLLLARTDTAVPKHRGLTYFLLDMSLPGIDVRPLRQLTGEAEFNEVHFDGVRVPASAVLGGVGQGWHVAMTTLMNERVAIGGVGLERNGGPIRQALSSFVEARDSGTAGAVEGERLMRLWTSAEAARLTNQRAARRQGEPGPEGSLAKLQMAEGNQATYDFCVELAGTDGMVVDHYDLGDGASSAVFGGVDVRKAWLRSLANSIEGGTSEVLRNVLGERVLGLPQEPRVDRDVPWDRTTRS